MSSDADREFPRKNRPAAAKLFVQESLMNLLADIGDDAYETETLPKGNVYGSTYEDDRGRWIEASSITESGEIIGWFRVSESDGLEMSKDDIEHHKKLIGKNGGFAFMIDSVQSSIAIFTLEDGVPVNPRTVIEEGK